MMDNRRKWRSVVSQLAIFGLLYGASHAQQTWNGCVVPGENPAVRKGQQTSICLVVSSGDDWATVQIPYQRWLWTPIADQFASYTIPKSYQSFVTRENVMQPYVSVHVQSNSTLSFVRRWYDADQNRQLIFPYLTIIVDVFQGNIRGLVWDNGCVYCSKTVGNRCMEDTFNFNATPAIQNNQTYTNGINEPTKGCWLRKDECDKYTLQDGSNPVCDLKVYATWTGTDANKRVLTSADNRFSAFPMDQVQRTLSAVIEGASNTYEEVAGSVNSTVNSVSDTVNTVSDTVNSSTGGDNQ